MGDKRGNELKYTLEGFDQTAALKMQKTDEAGNTIKLDAIDLVILRWFVDFYPGMAKRMIGNKEYGWVKYDAIVNDLPLLDIQKRGIMRRFEKLKELGILEHVTIKDGGTFSFYTFGKQYMSLVCDDKGYTNFDTGCASKSTGGVLQKAQGCASKGTANNTSTKNNSSTKKNSKERKTFNERLEEYTDNQELRASLTEYIKMRAFIKAPMTDRAITLLLNDLDKLASSDADKIKIVNQSIVRSWKSVYPLQEESKKTKQEPELSEEEKQRRAENLERFRRNRIIG